MLDVRVCPLASRRCSSIRQLSVLNVLLYWWSMFSWNYHLVDLVALRVHTLSLLDILLVVSASTISLSIIVSVIFFRLILSRGLDALILSRKNCLTGTELVVLVFLWEHWSIRLHVPYLVTNSLRLHPSCLCISRWCLLFHVGWLRHLQRIYFLCWDWSLAMKMMRTNTKLSWWNKVLIRWFRLFWYHILVWVLDLF